MVYHFLIRVGFRCSVAPPLLRVTLSLSSENRDGEVCLWLGYVSSLVRLFLNSVSSMGSSLNLRWCVSLVNSPLSLQFIFKVVPIVVTLWTLSSPSWMPSCVWQTVIHPDSNAENILFDSYTYFFVKIVHFIYQEKPK